VKAVLFGHFLPSSPRSTWGLAWICWALWRQGLLPGCCLVLMSWHSPSVSPPAPPRASRSSQHCKEAKIWGRPSGLQSRRPGGRWPPRESRGVPPARGWGARPLLPAAARVAARAGLGSSHNRDLFWAVAAASACQSRRRWRLSAALRRCRSFRWVSVFHTLPGDETPGTRVQRKEKFIPFPTLLGS